MSYRDQSVTALQGLEGTIAWMYLDTRSFVTCATGEMVANAAAALKLPWRSQQTGDLAGASDVQADFQRVSQMAPGHEASFYRVDDSLILAAADMTALLSARVTGFEVNLRELFPEYDSFPDSAKLALIDMIYNLGAAGLGKDFPAFCDLVQQQRWQPAALECKRVGPSDARNDWTKQQFLAASAR
jgi:GH24 family phage-related lysozyme (muramidase)